MVIICVQLFTSLTYYPKSKLCFDSSLIEHPPPNLFVLPVPPKCIVSLSTSIKVACCGHFEGPVSMRPPGAWIKTCSSHVKSVFCQFYYEPRHKNSGGVKEEISRCLTTPAVGPSEERWTRISTLSRLPLLSSSCSWPAGEALSAHTTPPCSSQNSKTDFPRQGTSAPLTSQALENDAGDEVGTWKLMHPSLVY